MSLIFLKNYKCSNIFLIINTGTKVKIYIIPFFSLCITQSMLNFSMKAQKACINWIPNVKKICNTTTVRSYMQDNTVAGWYNFFITIFSLPLSLSLLFSLWLSPCDSILTPSLTSLSRSRLATKATWAVLHGVHCGGMWVVARLCMEIGRASLARQGGF